MLVSVGLVMLMMVLFAQIFGMASESMTLQRAIAENDQQVRTFTTVLRGDLSKRTFRTLAPFHPKENADLQVVPYSGRDGYFHISLNAPADQTDNVLAFTVRSTIKLESGDETPYVGKATNLEPPNGNFLGNPNQPEHDDGQIDVNGAAASTAAEICYFMRGKNLYRRVVLIREPLPASGADDPNPRHEASREFYFDPSAPNLPAVYQGHFWQDFDFATFNGSIIQNLRAPNAPLENDPTILAANVVHGRANFIGIDALDNGPSRGIALGQSRYRFGFNSFDGLPREYLSSGSNAQFMGRFTLEEMSMRNFEFPQRAAHDGGGNQVGNGNPFDTFGTTLNDANANYIIDEFESFYVGQNAAANTNVEPTRRGEDLLLSNVHGFEIEVWDSRVGDFVTIGHSRLGPGPDRIPGTNDDEFGDYHSARWMEVLEPQNPPYRAPGGQSRIFDSWHPQYNRDSDTSTGVTPGVGPALGYDLPPYRALRYYPPDYTNLANTINIAGYRAPFLDDNNSASVKAYWEPNVQYSVGDRVFPQPQRQDPNDPGIVANPQGYSMYYECVRAGTSGMNPVDEPVWPLTAGQIFEPPVNSGEPRWQAVANVVPLQTIRITVRFRHVSSNQMRQLTLIHSLVD